MCSEFGMLITDVERERVNELNEGNKIIKLNVRRKANVIIIAVVTFLSCILTTRRGRCSGSCCIENNDQCDKYD